MWRLVRALYALLALVLARLLARALGARQRRVQADEARALALAERARVQRSRGAGVSDVQIHIAEQPVDAAVLAARMRWAASQEREGRRRT